MHTQMQYQDIIVKGVEFWIPSGGGGIPAQMKSGQVRRHMREWCERYNVEPVDVIKSKGALTYYFLNTDIPKFVITWENDFAYTLTD